MYMLSGSIKDETKNDFTTAFLNDGGYVSISSSKIADPSTYWGVKRGDFLELTFDVPPLQNGHKEEYYVMTLGYYIKVNGE